MDGLIASLISVTAITTMGKVVRRPSPIETVATGASVAAASPPWPAGTGAPARASRCWAPGLDAFLAGASSWDGDDIAKVIEQRPRPSYEERLAVFKRDRPTRAFARAFPGPSKGGGRPRF